jgi:hypothetical protein
MNENQSKLPLKTFWYGVTFFAGLYWGISFRSGAWGHSVVFPLLAPPFVCLGMAVAAAMIGDGDRRHIILGAVTLYVTFLFTFGIGYGLADAGIVSFRYNTPR